MTTTISGTWTPYDYQLEGARWLVDHPRSIIADEMGLGKTIQIGMLFDIVNPDNTLIVCKSVLAYHWQDELREKFALDADIATGTDAEALEIVRDGSIVITNYAKLRLPRFQDAILSRGWNALVIDEAHRVKGRKADQSKFLFKLARQVLRIHFVSGSPMPNGSPSELWTWLHAIDPKRFSSYWRWVNETCIQEETEWGVKVGGARDPEQLARRLTDYLIRRRVADVGPQLPDLLPTTLIRHDLSPRQKTMYTQMRKEFIITLAKETFEAPNTAARWEALRRVCLSPLLFPGETDAGAKVEAILAIAEELYAEKIKFVVFTWHRDFAVQLQRLISEHLDTIGGIIVGGMDSESQFDQARKFDAGYWRFLVGTIAAMGEGLNLQVAGAVIFAEMSYVPEDNMQAIKRVHRHGQGRHVRVYATVARGTCEEYIYRIVGEKRQTFVASMDAIRAVQDG